VGAAVSIGYDLKSAANELSWPNMIPPALNETVRQLEISAFESILSTRAPGDWSPMEIMGVARLSGHLAQQIKDEDTLKRTGGLIKSPNNEKQFIRNPMLDVVSTRQAVINQLNRQLGVSLPNIDVSVLSNSAKTSNEARRNDSVFSLLARPV
jgi:hypothetical protein